MAGRAIEEKLPWLLEDFQRAAKLFGTGISNNSDSGV